MDAFSYLSVLLSIILGLGLTQVPTAIGRLVRHPRAHARPLAPAALGRRALAHLCAVWWSMYGLRLRRDWTFLAFGVVLAQTATLYLMAAVALSSRA